MKTLTAFALFLLHSLAAHGATGGPDSHGYTWTDSDAHTTIAPEYQWVDITQSGAEKLGHGDTEKGADFFYDGPSQVFYTSSRTRVVASKNGYLSFGGTDTGENSANFCPIPSAPNSDSALRLMVLHDNLDFSQGIGGGLIDRGKILYEYFPESPHPHHTCGVHVISWENMVHMGESQAFSFQVLLFDNFDIIYQFDDRNPENGSGSSTGIQQSSSVGLEVACDTANSIPDNYAVLFEPPTIVVGTLDDVISSPNISLRQALTATPDGRKIVFDSSLDRGLITLDPSLPVPGLDTFGERSIDASALAGGITIHGGGETPLYGALARTHFSNIQFIDGAPETDGGGWAHGGLSLSRLSDTDPFIQVTLSHCRFAGNESDNGGGLFVDDGGHVYLANCDFFENSAVSEGGAIFADTEHLIHARKCSFRYNNAQRGGAIYANSPIATTFRLEDCAFENNTANKGAGLYYDNPLVPSTRRCLFADNESTGRGGAIFATGVEALEFYTCTFSSNDGSEGSVLYQADSPDAFTSTKFRHCTFVNNWGTNLDGADGEAIDVGHCVFDGVFYGEFFGGDLSYSSSGFNMAVGADPILVDPNDLTGSSPMLGVLAENGGPTRTHALSVGSAAIDAGDGDGPASGDIDQRGYSRVVGGTIDIGAYEFQGNIEVTTAVDELVDPGAGVSLREALRDIAPGAQVTFDPNLDGATIALGGSRIDIDRAVTVDASALADGVTIDGGGASRVLSVSGPVSVSLHNLDLVGGAATGSATGGGGLTVTLGAAVSMFDGSVRGGTSEAPGGGIAVRSGSLRMVDCLVSGNEAKFIDGDGGGISAEYFSLVELQRTTVGNNVSSGDGGGIWAASDSYVSLGSCTIAKNTAAGSGGGFSSSESDGLVGNSTISGNVAGGGGGAFHGSNSEVEFQFSTIADNRAVSTAGGIVTSAFASGGGGRPTFSHCIIAANRLVGTGLLNIRTFDQDAEPESKGYNLIDDDSLSGAIATDLTERVAYLAPLANYGSDSQTHALLNISPAIDAGDPTGEDAPSTDQRGYARIADGRTAGAGRIDIGAHEAAAPVLVGDLLDVVDGAGQRSLRGALDEVEAGGRILFKQTLNGGVIDLSTAGGGQGTQLLIEKSVQIDATALSDGITISGGGESRVFDITGGVDVAMHALRVEDGFTGAGEDGGGFRISRNADLLLTHSSVSGNRGRDGGAFHISGGASARLQNVTVSGNTAQREGAAIKLDGAGSSATLEHCSVVDQILAGVGTVGGFSLGAGKLSLYSTVLANTPDAIFAADNADYSNITSLGYNLADDGGVLVGGLFSAPGDQTGVNPNLTVLQDIGGWSKVHRYQASSALRDAGDPEPSLLPALSATGGVRSVGQMDIGAEERNGRSRDGDGDQIPDYWENLYGFDVDDAMDADEDADGDGTTNLIEFQNGTNPLRSDLVAAVPQIVDLRRVTPWSLEVEFTTQGGISYVFEESGDLQTWVTSSVLTGEVGLATTVYAPTTSAYERRYYRVRLAEGQ